MQVAKFHGSMVNIDHVGHFLIPFETERRAAA